MSSNTTPDPAKLAELLELINTSRAKVESLHQARSAGTLTDEHLTELESIDTTMEEIERQVAALCESA